MDRIKLALTAFGFIVVFAAIAAAQTSAISYQGDLKQSGVAAQGTYEMQFRLFDAVTGGSQVNIYGVRLALNFVTHLSFTSQSDEQKPESTAVVSLKSLLLFLAISQKRKPLSYASHRIRIENCPYIYTTR